MAGYGNVNDAYEFIDKHGLDELEELLRVKAIIHENSEDG